jgi:hypothetical protein
VEILVNDRQIDFTLEDENTVCEVLEGLDTWLDGQGWVASAVRINGKTLDQEDGKRQINEIGRIEVEAVRSSDLPREHLTTLHRYLSLLVGALADGKDGAAREVLAEYPYIRKSLSAFLADMLGDVGSNQFNKLDPALASLADDPSPAGRTGDEVLELLNYTIQLIQSRLREMEDPRRELAAVMGLVMGMLPDVREVPVQLQTGEDSAAMQTVIRFTELTMKMLRILPAAPDLRALTVDDQPVDDHIQGLNEMLGELTEAFVANDTVLVGDLLEYEIVERIEALVTAVNRQMEGA